MLTKVTTYLSGAEVSTTMENLSAMQISTVNEDPFTTITNDFSLPRSASFAVGDIVQVLTDMDQVRDLQQGHGEWTEAMTPVSND